MTPPQTRRNEGEVLQDEWLSCYGESWNGIICPESFSHPAKFSLALVKKIYDHIAEEGWLKSGDTILDPFGGVGLGAYRSLQDGYTFYAIELEPDFVDRGRGCDCTGIDRTAWVRFYGRWSRPNRRDGRYWCPRCLTEAPQVTGGLKPKRRTFRT